MSYYLHNVEMPFCGKNISFREIKNYEQIAITKANLAMPSDNNEPELYNNFLKKIIFQCVENQDVLKELNIIEYILFATKLRMISFGSELELQQDIENDDDKKDVKKIKIKVNLQTFIKNIYEASKLVKSTPIICDGIEVFLTWPKHNDQEYFFNLRNSELNSIISSLYLFIKKIKIKNQIINLWDFSYEERENIFNNLSISIRVKIQNEVINMLQFQGSQDLFGVKQLNDYKFSFYNTIYLDILRLFYSFDLKEIYKEYYALALKQIPPSYIDDITTIERKLYLSILQEERNSKAGDTGGVSSGETTLQDLEREFGG
jgi:hypothetical protein